MQVFCSSECKEAYRNNKDPRPPVLLEINDPLRKYTKFQPWYEWHSQRKLCPQCRLPLNHTQATTVWMG
jgi:hypothetical protein